jgi:thiol-disulfide isomerase/thioredoxin
MKLFVSRLVCSAAVVCATLASVPVLAQSHAGEGKSAVAWIAGDSEATVQKAFATARSSKKPVLLYWGAVWCPPCNRLKATLFNRQDFIALSRSVVPVYLDGDLPGAQKLGSRYRVVGYPTLIVFSPDGNEVTRLAGEAEAKQVVDSLRLALAGGRSAKQILADAQAGKALKANEWRLLAFYSWETDESQLLAAEEPADVLRDLSERAMAVDAEASLRLWLKSYAVAAKPECADRVADNARLDALLASPVQSRLHADMLIYAARALVLALSEPQTPGRDALVARLDAVLLRIQNDPGVANADRIEALGTRVELARVEAGEGEVRVMLPLPLLDETRSVARRMDKEVTNAYERQAVITTAGHVLARAGLWDESSRLLEAGLRKSNAPYYLMSQLGSNARKLGDAAKALDWYERAYKESTGPSTRLQWGTSYLGALVDLAPENSARIEAAVSSLLADAAKDKAAMYERSRRSLQRMVGHLKRWSETASVTGTPPSFHQRFLDYCATLSEQDDQRQRCRRLWE